MSSAPQQSSSTGYQIKLATKTITSEYLGEIIDILGMAILTQRIADIEDNCNEAKSPLLILKYVSPL